MQLKNYVLLFALAVGTQLYSQETANFTPEELIQKLNIHRDCSRLEKIYLKTDKPYYLLGETLWFAAYLRDEYTLEKSKISQSLYVELIDPDGKIVGSKHVYLDSTHCHGEFGLGLDAMHGKYRLRAYTSWLRNYGSKHFFYKDIWVYSLASEANKTGKTPGISGMNPGKNTSSKKNMRPDIQFFPEAGHSIMRIKGRVGVKLTEPNGKGRAFHASIFDSLHNRIGVIHGNEWGMGSFEYLPKFHSGDYVLLDNHQDSIKYFLPASQPEGVALSVTNMNDKEAKVKIQYSSTKINKGGKLMIVSGNESIGLVPLRAAAAFLQFGIPLERVRDGIITFTLFDYEDRPVAERIIFLYTKPFVSSKLNHPSFTKRTKVKLNIKLANSKGDPLSGKASVAVVDQNLVRMNGVHENILTELLMGKEIRGKIENPVWYFENYDETKRVALDHLMLCQGWRRFRWVDSLVKVPPKIRYIPDKGITISGVTNALKDEDKKIKTQVTMISTRGPFQYGEVITTDSGSFAFTGMVFFDTVSLVFQANKYNIKRQKATENRNVNLKLLERTPPQVPPPSRKGGELALPNSFLEDYIIERKKIEQIKLTYDPQTYDLDTVSITARPAASLGSNSSGSSELLYRANLDSMPGGLAGSIWEFLNWDFETQRIIRGFGSIGGGLVVDEEGNQDFVDVNNFLPVWLDGFQLTEQDAKSTPISSVGIVEVLASADVASAQGTENGAIMLYSRSGGGLVNMVVRGINGLKHPGFYVAKEFYKPVYEQEAQSAERPDRRVTLHWEPAVFFDKDGTASVSFFTDDKAGRYAIQIEGISDDGQPFVHQLEIENE